jgi:hypothetical protein
VPLIQVLIVLIVIGVLLWLVNSLIPMDAKIRQIINVLTVIVVILWLLTLFFPALLRMGPYVGPR